MYFLNFLEVLYFFNQHEDVDIKPYIPFINPHYITSIY